jgi:hypothetical protein
MRPTGESAVDAVDDRELVLVCAEETLRSALAELVCARGYEPRVPATPLQAIEALIDSGDRIGWALLASDSGPGLHDFLADEYPEVRRVLQSA